MGVGDSWGTREELLHPRDSKGRFRSKWKMSGAAVDRVLKILTGFAPKTWPSDAEAASYVSTLAPKKPAKLPLDRWSQMQADIRAGKGSKDLAVYEAAEYLLPEDLILTSVMDAKAFGLTPETIGQMEEYTGKLVANKGPTSTNVGTPVGPGQVTLSIAAPKGTRAVIPGGGSREVILSAEQPLRITKVDPDGKGGFYVYATAMPKGSKGETRTKKLGTRAPTPTDPDGDGIPGVAPAAGAPAGAPADPNAPQPRVEEIQSPAVGGDGAPAAPEKAPEAPSTGPDTSPAPTGGKSEPATPEQGTPQVEPVQPGQELTDFDREVQRLAAEELARRIEARAGGGQERGTDQAPAPVKKLPAKKAVAKKAATPALSDEELDRRVAQAERRKKAKTREAIRPGSGAERRKANQEMLERNRQRGEENAKEVDAENKAIADALGLELPQDPFLQTMIGLTDAQMKSGSLSKKKAAERYREMADTRSGKDADILRRFADAVAGAPAKKATAPAPGKPAGDVDTATIPGLRQIAKDEGITIPSSVRRKADIQAYIKEQRGGSAAPAKKAAPKLDVIPRGTPGADAARKAAPARVSVEDLVATRLVERLGEIDPAVRDRILADLPPADRREVDAARDRVERDRAGKAPKLDTIVRGTPGADAARKAAPAGRPAPGTVRSTVPLANNTWAGVPGDGGVHYHPDGAIGRTVANLGPDGRLDVDGEPIANLLGRIATDTVMGRTSGQEQVERIKRLRDKLPQGSRVRQALDQLVAQLDAPKINKPSVPNSAPEPLKKLADDLFDIPAIRQDRSRELDPLIEILKEFDAGQLSGMRLISRIRALHNRRHESTESKQEIDTKIQDAIRALEGIGGRNLRPVSRDRDASPTAEVTSNNLDPDVEVPASMGGGRAKFSELRARAAERGIPIPIGVVTPQEVRDYIDTEIQRRRTREEGGLAPGDVVVQAPGKRPQVVEASQESAEALEISSIADLRNAAEAMGVRVPTSLRTKKEIMDFLATRGARKSAPKAAKKAAAPKKRVPTALDQFMEGADRSLFPEIWDEVERALAEGDKTPRSIGRDLETTGKNVNSMAAIRYLGLDTPEAKRDRAAAQQASAQMIMVGRRLQEYTRPSAPREARVRRVPGRNLTEFVQTSPKFKAAAGFRGGGTKSVAGDGMLTDIVREQGWLEPAGVGTPEEVTRAVQEDGWIEVFRGVADFRGKTFRDQFSEMRTSPDFVLGTGIYGNGIYTSTGRNAAEQYAVGRSTGRGGIIRMAIDPKAKIIDFDDLLKEWKRFQTVAQRKYGRDVEFSAGDAGRYAAMMGYDIVRIDKSHGDGTGNEFDQYMILNRTAALMENEP